MQLLLPFAKTLPRIQDDLRNKIVSSYVEHAHLNPYKNLTSDELSKAGVCLYDIYIYPTAELIDSFKTGKPTVYTTAVGLVFFLMAGTFFMFNRYIQIRNNKVVLAAAKSTAIVSTIFPSSVRDRLFANAYSPGNEVNQAAVPSRGMKEFLNTSNSQINTKNDGSLLYDTKPIADLFPEVR
jgi:hypothetical protein